MAVHIKQVERHMSNTDGLNRRTFLRNAGMTAIVGAAGLGTSCSTPAATPAAAPPPAPEGSMKFDFDTPYVCMGFDSSKWDGVQAMYPNDKILNGMGTADMDFRAAPCITAALAERAKHENWGYYTIPNKLYEAIANYNKRRYNLDIDPKTIQLLTGVHAGLIAAIQTFAPPGTRVLLLTPAYSGFYGDITFTHTVKEECLMPFSNGQYTIDFDAFDKAASRSNVFIMCNPHNPTGNNWSAADCLRLGEICLKHKVVVLSDEIHCDFMAKGQKYTPWATLPNKDVVNNSLTFKSTSKSFGMPGQKCAWYFSTNPDYMTRVRANTRADISTFGAVSAMAALTEGEPWLDALLPYIDGNQDFAHQFIKANFGPLVKETTRAEGTYLLWLDVSGLIQKINAKKLAEDKTKAMGGGTIVTPTMIVNDWFVHNAHVHLNPGSSYGLGGEEKIRVNLAESRKMLEQALTNMAAALKTVST